VAAVPIASQTKKKKINVSRLVQNFVWTNKDWEESDVDYPRFCPHTGLE
jgi:hypothetical protein